MMGNDITPRKNTFLGKGSRMCPKPTEGEQLTDNIQKIGLISNKKITADEFAEYKRNHWRIEIVRIMQIKEPKGRELVIDVLDEIASDLSVVDKYLFEPISSFY